jgi:hypothetical protein
MTEHHRANGRDFQEPEDANHRSYWGTPSRRGCGVYIIMLREHCVRSKGSGFQQGERVAKLIAAFGGLCLVLLSVPVYAQQQCLHGPGETPDQTARRREALTATRTVNNLQANQPGSANRTFLKQAELPTSQFAQGRGGQSEFFKKLNFNPGEELLPGWVLTLDVTPDGYWFMIKDKMDPCGFAFVSNTAGVIYTAEPIR